MIIYLTYDNYMKAAGCSASTMRRRMQLNIITPCDIKSLSLCGVIYDTEMNIMWSKVGQGMKHPCPSHEQLVNNGVEHSVINVSRGDTYDDTYVNVPRNMREHHMTHERISGDAEMGAYMRSLYAGHLPDVTDNEICLILNIVREVMLRPEITRKTSGDVKLHRKLLNNQIMDSPVLSYVFIELMLMASAKGEVEITSPIKSVKNIGAEAYATALMLLENKHGAVKLDIRDGVLYVKLVKWNNYQPLDIDNVVIRDMDNPDVEILPEGDAQSFPPTTPLSLHSNITPYSPPDLKKDTNFVSVERNESEEPEQTTTPAPKKKRQKRLKDPRDPYKLEDYEPKYRPFVPFAHEIYEYYRDKLGSSSARITAIDRIVPLLTVYPKEAIIEAIDNYYSEIRQRNTEAKYVKKAETFFQDYYTAYLTDELPKTKQKQPQGTKSRIPENVEVIHIGDNNE